jgi:transglutaminase-like putative cysteine protease
VAGVRVLLYSFSLLLYLVPLATWSGMLSAVLAALVGMRLGTSAHRRGLRVGAVLVLGLPAFLLCLALGEWLQNAAWFSRTLGVRNALYAAEALSLGLAAMVAAFVLRFLARAARALSLLEVLFVAGSVAALLADHRNRMLNRPRFFSDWAWSLGVTPTTVLVAAGIVATLAAILLFLRGQRLLKLLTTLLLFALLGAAFYVLWDKRIETVTRDPLGLSGKKKDKEGGKGKQGKGGGGGGGGSSSDPFKDDYSGGGEPSPVAIAILRDDLETSSQILYFRQTALSYYNGHHLVSGPDQGWDRDVITKFPRHGALTGARTQSPENHVDLPTTMYLLVDHPQPVALTHAAWIKTVANPNPQQFVAAYDVRSKVLSVEPNRLLGRRSIPPDWPEAWKRHYTALPDDPRYRALADIIVRDVDPRFAGDDLARAFAIKRYLEREGFYTMKSKHSSKRDPVSSFLFGSLRGYCVHFAHAAVYMLRSQGIAARVALGYAVQINKRSGGSAILIMGDRAHAWPEIHLEGIGWVTFDVYPERTDMPPPVPVDYDLEKLLGELARNDPTAGVRPEGPLRIPWRTVLLAASLAIGALLVLSYVVKAYRRLAPRLRGRGVYPRLAYVAVLDLLSDLGAGRRPGETRERHAARLQQLSPHLPQLTRAHLARALGGRGESAEDFGRLVAQVHQDIRTHVHPARRFLAGLNPIGWIWTR